VLPTPPELSLQQEVSLQQEALQLQHFMKRQLHHQQSSSLKTRSGLQQQMSAQRRSLRRQHSMLSPKQSQPRQSSLVAAFERQNTSESTGGSACPKPWMFLQELPPTINADVCATSTGSNIPAADGWFSQHRQASPRLGRMSLNTKADERQSLRSRYEQPVGPSKWPQQGRPSGSSSADDDRNSDGESEDGGSVVMTPAPPAWWSRKARSLFGGGPVSPRGPARSPREVSGRTPTVLLTPSPAVLAQSMSVEQTQLQQEQRQQEQQQQQKQQEASRPQGILLDGGIPCAIDTSRHISRMRLAGLDGMVNKHFVASPGNAADTSGGGTAATAATAMATAAAAASFDVRDVAPHQRMAWMGAHQPPRHPSPQRPQQLQQSIIKQQVQAQIEVMQLQLQQLQDQLLITEPPENPSQQVKKRPIRSAYRQP
ncbi:hypothetical protein Vretifemale_12748, partial [Volvox reticuliferus]